MKSEPAQSLTKPFHNDEPGEAIEGGLRISLVPFQDDFRATNPNASGVFFSCNPRMRRIQCAMKRISASDVPVLLQGESGVGKEIVARHLHALSSRAGRPFLKLNCAALPAELLESELFGYERGAFTGAFKSKPGKFEMAEGGVILLDEIGDMDYRLQAKLLQVLQDHEFHRLGGRETVRVDVRVMAATHCDLEEGIRERRFREDLYYRLNVVTIEVPPLRERKDEILRLAELFLTKYMTDGEPMLEMTPRLEQALLVYDWPGNVRELENTMRRFLVFGDPEMLADELLLKKSRSQTASLPTRPAPLFQRPTFDGQESSVPTLERVNQASKEAESDLILSALDSTRWNRKQAAALLNIDYKALLYKMKKLSIA